VDGEAGADRDYPGTRYKPTIQISRSGIAVRPAAPCRGARGTAAGLDG
jgi:hypothetical protein